MANVIQQSDSIQAISSLYPWRREEARQTIKILQAPSEGGGPLRSISAGGHVEALKTAGSILTDI